MKPVTALSGGERRRLGLACLVASGANFLVLDEPTNHLDLESREALEAALEAFPGTLLLVSHDRALLDAVAERTLAVEDGTIHAYDGGWADYVRARDEREATMDAAPPSAPKQASKPRRREPRPERTPLEDVESQIEAQERLIQRLEARLAEHWDDLGVVDEHRRAREELQALLARWESLLDEVAG
jgi:ATP-binding cassette subfamily F protein 3